MQNGIHEIYVNAEAKDGSIHADLMQYFVNSTGYHPIFKKLSQKGVNEMSNIFEEYAEERANDERKIIALKLLKEPAFTLNKIAELTGLKECELEQLKATTA